jgi:hypothetical protein
MKNQSHSHLQKAAHIIIYSLQHRWTCVCVESSRKYDLVNLTPNQKLVMEIKGAVATIMCVKN